MTDSVGWRFQLGQLWQRGFWRKAFWRKGFEGKALKEIVQGRCGGDIFGGKTFDVNEGRFVYACEASDCSSSATCSDVVT